MGLLSARLLAFAVLLSSAFVLSCLPIDVSFEKEKEAAKVGTVRGVVENTSGDALEGVRVTAGDASTTTDEAGRFTLEAPEGHVLVRFGLEDHVGIVRSLRLTHRYATQLDVSLHPRAEPVRLDASEGGEVLGERGAALRAPEGAFSDAAGRPIEGMVDIYLSPLASGSNGELAAAPGLVTRVDDDPQLIDTFGIIELRVEQQGKALDVESGKQLELEIPIAEDLQPPAELGVWRYDSTKDLWLREGKADFDSDARTFIARVDRAGLWSVGDVYAATCICGVVNETGKGPLMGARIEVAGISYSGTSSEQSDSNGRFCIAVGKDAEIEVAVYHASTGGESKRIQTKSASTLVPPRSNDPRCEDVGTWRVTKAAEDE